jgi:hypothetical protein
MGGPTYVEDPRVQEAVALGELLLRSRAAAQTQSDRLFERKQALNDFDERRRQFNEEQQRLADAAKMSAADQERRLGLEQQRLAADAEQFGQRLAADTAGAAEDRLFRRDDAAARDRNRVADNERADAQQREAKARYDAEVGRGETRYQEQRSDAKQRDTIGRMDQIRQDALRQAEIAGREEQAIKADISRMDEKRLDREAEAAEWRAKLTFAEDREKAKAEKVLGTEDVQRERGLSNTLARFEEEVKRAKSAKDDQSREEELAAAVQRVLFPPPDVDGRNSTDVLDGSGRPLPVWRPSPADLEALKPALLEVMAQHFPKVKKAGYPKVTQILDVPLIAPLTQALTRGAYEAARILGGGPQDAVGDFFSIPREVVDPGARALEETLKRSEKAQALFRRK